MYACVCIPLKKMICRNVALRLVFCNNLEWVATCLLIEQKSQQSQTVSKVANATQNSKRKNSSDFFNCMKNVHLANAVRSVRTLNSKYANRTDTFAFFFLLSVKLFAIREQCNSFSVQHIKYEINWDKNKQMGELA